MSDECSTKELNTQTGKSSRLVIHSTYIRDPNDGQ